MIYIAISTWLENQVNDSLRLTATQVASVFYDVEAPQNPLDIADVRLQLESGGLAAQSFLRDRLFFIRLIDPSEQIVLAASADYGIPPSPARSDAASYDTVVVDSAAEMRIYTLPLAYAPRYVFQVGLSLAETRAIQRDVLGILLVLGLCVVALAPLTGWFLAERALLPIRALARTAAEINETDLSRRLDLTAAEVELEQLMRTFNAMLDRIEAAFQRQRQFSTDAAHELRTPLAIMQTGLEVTLSRARGAPEYHAALVSIQEEVQRLTQLANTLLLLARADAHELPLEIRTVDLNLLLLAVIEQFAPAANAKGITLAHHIPPGLSLQADQDRLIQVIFNLLDNAVKYTPEGGQVRVSAEAADHAAAVTIADSGPGIPAEDQAHIFDRFYRADSSRNRARGGFGLGLAIARRIVELHGGTIRVISQPGHGAQFIITLPARVRTPAPLA